MVSETLVGEEQSRFVKGKEYVDQMFAFRQALEKIQK